MIQVPISVGDAQNLVFPPWFESAISPVHIVNAEHLPAVYFSKPQGDKAMIPPPFNAHVKGNDVLCTFRPLEFTILALLRSFVYQDTYLLYIISQNATLSLLTTAVSPKAQGTEH